MRLVKFYQIKKAPAKTGALGCESFFFSGQTRRKNGVSVFEDNAFRFKHRYAAHGRYILCDVPKILKLRGVSVFVNQFFDIFVYVHPIFLSFQPVP